MAPIVHGLEALYGDQMNFVYLDIDNPANDPLKEALGYRERPHLFLIDGEGKILRQWVGFVDGEELQTAIEFALP